VKILALSTSTPRGSAAVFDDDRALASVAYADLKGHAERLFHAIDQALADAGIDRTALDAIACDIGPGSFTGVRVGVASAKGIALALGIPLVGVTSLHAMAQAAFDEGAASDDQAVLATLDAKKNEIFRAAYGRTAGELEALLLPEAAPVELAAFSLPQAARRLVVIGEIAASIQPPLPLVARGPSFDLPDARWIARIGLRRLAEGKEYDPAHLEPLYVRAPDAKPIAPPTETAPDELGYTAPR